MRANLPTLVALLLFGCGVAPRHDGWEVGSGGGHCPSAWVDAVNEVRAIVSEGHHPRIAVVELEAAIARTRIVYRASVRLGQSEVEAVNFAHAKPARIELGCDRFVALAPALRTELAVHELASILGLDDSRKQISGALDIARVCGRRTVVRKGIETAAGKPCNVIRSADLARVSELRLRLKHLVTADQRDFAGLLGLRRLDLSYNSIERLPPAVFAGLPRLAYLDLRGNEMTVLPTGLFAGAALEELSGHSARDASAYWENPIERIERGFLGPDSQAIQVNVCPREGGFVRELADGAFTGLREDAEVSLCVAFAAPVRPEALAGLEKAARLRLVGSGLMHLPNHFFSSARAHAMDFSGDGSLTLSQLNAIDGNYNLSVVRFFRRAQIKSLTGFRCRALAPTGREPPYVKLDEPVVCYRRH